MDESTTPAERTPRRRAVLAGYLFALDAPVHRPDCDGAVGALDALARLFAAWGQDRWVRAGQSPRRRR